jgi:capsule polysaccharide export protein KpsE/RkpR
MNPIVLWRIVAAVGVLLGIGGTAYGVDQHQKRKKEQAANRARLQQLEAELATKELQLASLRALLGDKNEQVRILAAEVARLRSAANDMRRSA